jgi:hypothetical protein
MPEGRDIEAAMGARDARAAGVESAGGGSGGGYNQGELANALADALSAGFAASAEAQYGAIAAEDVGQETFADAPPGGWGPAAMSPMEQEMANRQAQEDAAVRAEQEAAAQANITSAQYGDIGATVGYDPTSSQQVDTFGSYTQAGLAPSAYAAGQKYGGEQPSVEAFGQRWQTAVAPTGGYQDVLGSQAGLQQAQDASYGTMATEEGDAGIPGEYAFASPQTAAGTPGFTQPWGMGVVDTFANNPYAEVSGTGIGGPGMAAPLGSGNIPGVTMATEEFDSGIAGESGATQGQGGLSQNIGLINAGAQSPYGDPAGRLAKPGVGAITAGTVTQDAGADALPVNFVNQKVADITAKVNTPETNTAAHKQVAQSRLDMQTTLDEKAKADPNGNSGYPGVSNQRLANAYRGFDTTLAAYATINGPNSLVSMIANNLPGVNMASKMLGGISSFLVNRGIFNKTSAEDIAKMIGENLAAGARPGAGSQWESGPSDEDVQGPAEIRSFIQQYPWAAELDPRYVKYLIDNPAALQDLLGGATTGGTVVATDPKLPAPVPGGDQIGGGTKPWYGTPPAGFTQTGGAATMALVEWSNPSTGETWTAPNGGWQGPPGWVRV